MFFIMPLKSRRGTSVAFLIAGDVRDNFRLEHGTVHRLTCVESMHNRVACRWRSFRISWGKLAIVQAPSM